MDALVDAAIRKVIDAVPRANDDSLPIHQRKTLIARAINAVDALKSALKTIQ